MNYVFSVAYLILTIVIYYISLRMYNSSINPLFCVVGIFCIALSLFYVADFIDHNLSSKTIVIYLLGLISYTIGLVLMRILYSSKFTFRADYCSLDSENNKKNEYLMHNKIINLGFIITALSFLITLTYIFLHLGFKNYLINIFLSNKEMIETSPIYNINELLKKTLLIFSPMQITFALKYQKKRKACYLFSAIAILLSLTYTRVLFFYLLIVNASTFYFFSQTNKKGKLKIKTRILLILLLFIAVSFFMHTEKIFNKGVNTSGYIANYELNSDQLTLILYFIGTIKSSDIYINSDMESLPLAATFRYVYELFGKKTTESVGVPFVDIPIRYNTGVAQFYLYREGGYVWLVYASFMIGILIGTFFEDYKKYRTTDKITTASFLILCTLMAIRSYLPMFLEFWIPIIVLIVIRYKMRKARNIDNKKIMYSK